MSKHKLEPEMLIKTNYSGPYRIKSVERNCTCEAFPGILNDGEIAEPSLPHMHIICSNVDGKDEFYLNGYDEKTLKSTSKSWNDNDELEPDYITILKQDKPIQQTLF